MLNKIKEYEVDGLKFIEVINNYGLKVTLTNFGASIYTIYYKDALMNVQVENPKDFLPAYVRYGKTIGRVAGRVEQAQYRANGKTYHVTQNEGVNCLHGGDCLAQKYFEVESIKNHANGTKITFHYLSKDGENGFGGNFDIKVIYRVATDTSSLILEYEYVCDENCPINITNHTYYSLGDSNINNLKLFINASIYAKPRYLDMIPMELSSLTRCLDFTKPKLIIKDIDDPSINRGKLCGYDHFYLFNKIDEEDKQIVLSNDKFVMTMFTDFGGVQIYTNNNAKPIKCLNTTQERRRGIAIEPRTCALSQDIILRANQRMHHKVVIHFEENK